MTHVCPGLACPTGWARKVLGILPLATVTRTLLPRLHLHSHCSCGRWRSCWGPARSLSVPVHRHRYLKDSTISDPCVEFRNFLHKTPKALGASTGRGMVLLCLSCLTSPSSKLCPKVPVAWNEAFNSPARRYPEGSRMQPKLQRPCSSRRSPRFRLLGRSRLQCRGHLLGAPSRLKKCSQKTPKCSCNGRSPTPKKFPEKPEI